MPDTFLSNNNGRNRYEGLEIIVLRKLLLFYEQVCDEAATTSDRLVNDSVDLMFSDADCADFVVNRRSK